MSSSPVRKRPSKASAASSASRVDKWAKARQNGLVVPLLAQGVRRVKNKTGMRLSFGRVDGFKLPAAFLKERKGAAKTKLEFCVHVSLFHTTSQSFFGNTWVSPLAAAQSMSSKRASRLDLSNFQVALCTRIADPACLAVVEVVVVEKSSSGAEILGQYGCGWTSLPLFAATSRLARTDAKSSSLKQKVKMYSGSPRALLFIEDNESRHGDALQPLAGCTLNYSCSADPQIAKLSHLVRLNELIGPGQPLAGLRDGILPAKVSTSIKFASEMDLFINSVAILLPAQWEEQAEEYLRLRGDSMVKDKRKHNDVEDEADTEEDDRHGPRHGSRHGRRNNRRDDDEEKSRLILKVAPHNGRAVIDRNGWTQIPLKDVDYGGHPDYDRVLCHSQSVRLRNFPKDAQVAIAFQLEFYPERRKDAPGPIVVGCGVWLPFGADDAGPNLVLANIRAKDASTRCPLQIPLRSDLQCPFTDDGLFLPTRPDSIVPILGIYLGRKAEKIRIQHNEIISKSSPRRGHRENNWLDESDDESDDASHSSANSSAGVRLVAKERNVTAGEDEIAIAAADEAQVDSSILTRTLNLRIHDENVPATVGNTQSYTTIAQVPLDHHNKRANKPMELSRASRTVLNRMGVLDSLRTVVAPSQTEPNIDIELRDRLQASEITFQFAAYRHALGAFQVARPRSVFFTFQFYNALPTRTERMSLRAPETRNSEDAAAAGLSKPYILMRGDRDGKHRNSPSQALRYLVDCSLVDEAEPKRFAEYLKQSTLHVQVWDGDSLLSLGFVAVRLADIMRQGERSTKIAREFDVIAPSDTSSASGVQEIELFEGGAARGNLRGKVQLVVTNHGLRGRGRPPRASSSANAGSTSIADARWHMDRAFGGYGSDSGRRGEDVSLGQQRGEDALDGSGPRHRVIARPLAQTNAQLEGLLRAAQSTSHRRMRRKDEARLQIANGEVLESDWALSERELRRLARTLDRGNAGLVQLSALHSYLRIDETAARDTSRVWATLRACEPLCHPDTYHLFNNADVDHSGCVPEVTFGDILRKFLSESKVPDAELDLLCKRFQEAGTRVNYERFMKHLIGSHVGDLESKLRRVLRKARASSGVSYKEAFQHHFDANGDGRIQARELKRGLERLDFHQTSKADIDLLLRRYGDGTGLLLTDFVALAEARTPSAPHDVAREGIKDATKGSNGSATSPAATPASEQTLLDKVRSIVLESERRGVHVREVFAHFDKDGNGRISPAECREGLREIGVDAPAQEIQELIAKVDVDGSGELELDEFIGFLRAPASASPRPDSSAGLIDKVRDIVLKAKTRGVNIRDTFAHFDKDGNGLISREECAQGLESIGCKFSTTELDAFYATLDLDDDGNLSTVEFIAFLLQDDADAGPSAKQDSSAKMSETASAALGHLRELVQAKGRAHVKRVFSFLQDSEVSTHVPAPQVAKSLRALGYDALRPEHLESVLQHFDEKDNDTISVASLREFIADALDAAGRARGENNDDDKDEDEASVEGFLKANAERVKRRCRKHDRKDDGTISLSRFNRIVEECGWDGDEEMSPQDLGDLVTDDGRVEYERIGKDSVREKLVKAVSKAYDKGLNVADMLQSLDRQGLGKVSVSQMRRLVVDLGFSILEQGGEKGRNIVRDAFSSRQQSRIEKLREARMIRSSKSGMYNDLGLEDEDLGDAFARQASELQLVRRFREGHKRDVVGSLLRTNMTREVTLHPCYASASYFEIELANPFPHEEAIQIKYEDPELRCLTDGVEWRYYRESVPAAHKPEKFYPVESEMITTDSLELSLAGGEAVAVPFSFVSFASGQLGRDQRGSIRERTILVRFISMRHASAILEVQVHIKPRPFVVHRSIELHAGSGEFAKAHVRLCTGAVDSERFVYCGNPDVAVQWKDNAVSIKHRESESGSDFFVVLYKDAFHARVEAVWHVSVQSMLRVNFHGVVGQSSSSELIVKGDHFSRRVQCFTSNPGETRLHPADPFQLVAGAFNRIELVHQPLVETPHGRTREVRVHMVDLDSGELVSAWLVKASAALPDVSKTFDVDLPLHHASHKKIAYVNPWSEPRIFHIRTSDPAYARAKDPQLEIPPKSKAYIRLWFAAVHECTSRQVLIFVNDVNGQNDECLMLTTRHK
ncbi:Nephrocystin-4 [Hondaea fermentalgiana]|uniref:Nephrocystin-4 n=1 Tax=Hondaea fermentalgiana TaxID=2315210 RepID=A0A2R5GE65_9STRA|nr:Nephrocystin-4 [Hondaea fermentalgiana]|eukprot:GBG28865.1 Nephrocystin-4 [Hondaea fermentalgiana]